MEAKILLEELSEYTKCETIHLYIIERKIKPGAKRKDRASEKFEYIPHQVNMSQDLLPLVQSMLEKTIERKVNDDVEIKNYEVIDDTENKIQTYNDLGKITGFREFLNNKLGGTIKPIESLEQFNSIEKAWAICYGFYSDQKEGWLYCIKKLRGGKMAIGKENYENITQAVEGGVVSLFDLKTKSLKPFNGFSLNIEPSFILIKMKNSDFL